MNTQFQVVFSRISKIILVCDLDKSLYNFTGKKEEENTITNKKYLKKIKK